MKLFNIEFSWFVHREGYFNEQIEAKDGYEAIQEAIWQVRLAENIDEEIEIGDPDVEELEDLDDDL